VSSAVKVLKKTSGVNRRILCICVIQENPTPSEKDVCIGLRVFGLDYCTTVSAWVKTTAYVSVFQGFGTRLLVEISLKRCKRRKGKHALQLIVAKRFWVL